MVILGSVPILPIGVFYILYAFKKNSETRPDVQQQCKLVLRVLITSYAVIYLPGLIKVFTEISFSQMLQTPFLYFLLLIGIFAAGVYFSWKNELVAGLILIACYIGIIVFDKNYPHLDFDVGPVTIFGFFIMILGVLYLAYAILFIIIPRRRAVVASQ